MFGTNSRPTGRIQGLWSGFEVFGRNSRPSEVSGPSEVFRAFGGIPGLRANSGFLGESENFEVVSRISRIHKIANPIVPTEKI